VNQKWRTPEGLYRGFLGTGSAGGGGLLGSRSSPDWEIVQLQWSECPEGTGWVRGGRVCGPKCK
jgi:hypothetical protein